MTKRSLVVGCSGGIGKAIVSQLCAAGYEVLGLDKVLPEEDLSLLHFIDVDLRKADAVVNACNEIWQYTSELWAIVYNAGVYPIVSLEDYTLDLWDEVNNINVRAAFILLQNLHPLIVSGGRIVTIVSGAAHLGSRDIGYSSSKAGLLGLTKSLALNLSERSIQVNAVCPGPIDTPMSRRMPPKRVCEYEKRILIGRFGIPEEVSVAVEFLLEPHNTYMTGATLDVNGGLYIR